MSVTLGAALKAAREQRKLTLAQVSESTKVRIHYLQALENDDISAMPSAAQARGFLRLYADFLSLDLQELIPPAAAVVAPVTPAEAATEEPARDPAKPRMPRFLTALRARLGPRSAEDSRSTSEVLDASVDREPAPSDTPDPKAPSTDKKKQSR